MKATVVRTVLLALALINQVLTALGYQVLPLSDETVAELIGVSFTVVTALIAWWKNNSFGKGEKS